MGKDQQGKAGEQPSPAPSIESLFSKLSDSLADSEYKKAIKAADSVLSLLPGDKDAVSSKSFAQIMLGRYEDALQLMNSDDVVSEQKVFEKAYCCFKAGRLEEAQKLLQDEQGEAAKHLSGIVHMKQKNNAAASEVYKSLIPTVKGHKQAAIELATNTIAALVLSGDQSQISRVNQQLSISASDSFEVALNMACAAVHENRLADARKLLNLAETKGQEVLIEEGASQSTRALENNLDAGSAGEHSRQPLPEIEMEQDLAAIRAQAAHVSFLLGDVETAASGYSTLLSLNLSSDMGLMATCTNNSLCTRQDLNSLVKDAKRKLSAYVNAADMTVTTAIQSRLATNECDKLLRNYALACVLGSSAGAKGSNPMGNAKALLCNSTKLMMEQDPSSEAAALVHAATVGALSSAKEGVTVITGWLEGHADACATRPLLLGAQLACSGAPSPQWSLAASLLSDNRLDPSVRHSCAIVATRAAILVKSGEPDAGQRVLAAAVAAVEWWSKQPSSKEQGAALAVTLEHLVAVRLQQGDSAAALECLNLAKETISASGPGGRARLLACLAALDPASVPRVATNLQPQLSAAGVNIKDAEELEVSNIVSRGTSVLLGPFVRAAAEHGSDAKQVRKRKRKPRYPKGFDPENPGPPPNPERWLPKHERSDFRKRHRRRNQPVSKGAQGMGTVDASLDKSHITMEELDARQQPVGGPKLPKRIKGAGGKRKVKR